MCSGEETLPLCLVANFGRESDDIIVKEVLFKGQRIVDNISNVRTSAPCPLPRVETVGFI